MQTKILEYINALFHESYFPHLHRRLSRYDMIELNKLRKSLNFIPENVCPELKEYLAEGTLPNYKPEQVFESLQNVYKYKNFNIFPTVVQELISLPNHRISDFMTYWRHRDLSYYNIILFQQNINNFEKYIDLLEAAKAENPDLVRLYLKALDVEIVRKIVDFYEST